ncbi:hypothetical protein ACIQV3_18065 [Streptomyces sp. NPDC099050]|uniref:hypothetical protein n=1 Tax=Streptomyces sp. NPDC099050 TaxID=3366100 RepID=UPI003816BD1A
MPENEVTPEATDLGSIPAQITVAESPTVAVARERLVEAIGREAVFLADQRAGQASEGLEALARAFALVSSPGSAVTIAPASIGKRDIGQMGYDAYNEYAPATGARGKIIGIDLGTTNSAAFVIESGKAKAAE